MERRRFYRPSEKWNGAGVTFQRKTFPVFQGCWSEPQMKHRLIPGGAFHFGLSFQLCFIRVQSIVVIQSLLNVRTPEERRKDVATFTPLQSLVVKQSFALLPQSSEHAGLRDEDGIHGHTEFARNIVCRATFDRETLKRRPGRCRERGPDEF